MTDRPVGGEEAGDSKQEAPTSRWIQRALAGDPESLNTLVDRLTPVIQARVARSLMRNKPGFRGADPRELLKDLTQEVFLTLFKNGGETLRRWHPQGGASLENYVGLVAERKVISELRRAASRPSHDAVEPLETEEPSPEACPERQTYSRLLLHNLVAHFRRELSPLGWTMFELLFIWQGSVPEVSRDMEMNPEAVRKWRTRLRGMARHWLEKKNQEGGHHG